MDRWKNCFLFYLWAIEWLDWKFYCDSYYHTFLVLTVYFGMFRLLLNSIVIVLKYIAVQFHRISFNVSIRFLLFEEFYF